MHAYKMVLKTHHARSSKQVSKRDKLADSIVLNYVWHASGAAYELTL
jgi:hypothetical protein